MESISVKVKRVEWGWEPTLPYLNSLKSGSSEVGGVLGGYSTVSPALICFLAQLNKNLPSIWVFFTIVSCPHYPANKPKSASENNCLAVYDWRNEIPKLLLVQGF